MVYALDEPLADPAAINTFLICNQVRKKGHKVILSGMGADEIHFGYRRHKATFLVNKLSFIPSFIFKIFDLAISFLPVKVGKKGIKSIRWIKRFLSFTNMDIDNAYLRSYSYYSKSDLNKLTNFNSEELVNEIYHDHNKLFNNSYSKDLVNKICFTDLHLFMNGLNLTYTDRASMAASVEVRVPFIDKIFIEKAMNISGDLKFANWENKNILKKVGLNHMPEEFVLRPKASFSAPIRSWISNELKDLVDNLLSEENITKRGILNYNFVKKMIKEDRMGIRDNAYQIYQLLTLEIWFQRFIDKK